MPNLNSAANCICPFYMGETEKSISCEGMIGGTRARNVFASADLKMRHMETRCHTHAYGKRCWHAAALLAKSDGG